MGKSNVDKVMETLQDNPNLVVDFNKAVAAIIATAGVDITLDERKEVLRKIADSITGEGKEVTASISWK